PPPGETERAGKAGRDDRAISQETCPLGSTEDPKSERGAVADPSRTHLRGWWRVLPASGRPSWIPATHPGSPPLLFGLTHTLVWRGPHDGAALFRPAACRLFPAGRGARARGVDVDAGFAARRPRHRVSRSRRHGARAPSGAHA